MESEVKNEIKESNSEAIQNIDLSLFNKKKFSINGDPTKIIELDPSDLSIITRIQEQLPKLEKLQNRVSSLSDKLEGLDDRAMLEVTGSEFKAIDSEMRKAVDTIFDFPVCEVCIPTGSLYDPVNGRFKYEHLIDTLIKLYDSNLTSEYKKIQAKVSKYTSKYSRK